MFEPRPDTRIAIGAVILAGGGSRRMTRDKALLSLGGRTFLELILSRLRESRRRTGLFRELLISAAGDRYAGFGLPVINDQYPGCGPLGGIYSALRRCRSTHLLVLGCDMPFFDAALGEYLAGRFKRRHTNGRFDAVVPRTRDGRAQPLCAIYSASCADFLLPRIQAGDYRLTAALEDLRVDYVPLDKTRYSDRILRNINTPDEYRAVC
jgi:molybdopterin-guanine dinucleotide biosynthesis protein A